MSARIWLIGGATASGKSSLALRLARAIGGEIVGADALQIYRDLRILTARPSEADEALVPHHLYGAAEAAESWSVGRWLAAATAVLAGIAARGRPAVVVGGTGLYFRALTEGLAEAPQIAPAIRRKAAELFDALGEAAFRDDLRRRDPAAAARIFPGDRQRLLRAWEVHEAAGRPLSALQAETRPLLAPDSWRAIALQPPREALYARCDRRLDEMARNGVLAEVAALMRRGLDPTLPAMKAVGLREFAAHLSGDCSLAEAIALAQRETRRYAKRQSTWLRNQTPGWPRITSLDPDEQWRALQDLRLTEES